MATNNIKHIIIESDQEMDATYAFYEVYDEVESETAYQLLKAKETDRQPWELIDANRLIKIWTDYSNYGHVRDERGLNDIVDLFVRNVAKITLNTELMGHTQWWPYEEIKDKYAFSDEETERMKYVATETDYLSDEDGAWRLSDYGLEPLQKITNQLLMAKTSEEKLLLIDQGLNVIHMRSDLSSWFVVGGKATLSKLAGTEQYVEESKQLMFKNILMEYKANTYNNIKQLLREELTKADVEKTIETQFKKLIDSSDFKNKVTQIVVQAVKGNKEAEDKIVEITSNVLIQLYKSLWNRRSFWVGQLSNKRN